MVSRNILIGTVLKDYAPHVWNILSQPCMERMRNKMRVEFSTIIIFFLVGLMLFCCLFLHGR